MHSPPNAHLASRDVSEVLYRVVRIFVSVRSEDQDTKGDLYEYMLAQIASAG